VINNILTVLCYIYYLIVLAGDWGSRLATHNRSLEVGAGEVGAGGLWIHPGDLQPAAIVGILPSTVQYSTVQYSTVQRFSNYFY